MSRAALCSWAADYIISILLEHQPHHVHVVDHALTQVLLLVEGWRAIGHRSGQSEKLDDCPGGSANIVHMPDKLYDQRRMVESRRGSKVK